MGWHFATCLMCAGVGFLTCSLRSQPGPHPCSPARLQPVKEGNIVLACALSFCGDLPRARFVSAGICIGGCAWAAFHRRLRRVCLFRGNLHPCAGGVGAPVSRDCCCSHCGWVDIAFSLFFHHLTHRESSSVSLCSPGRNLSATAHKPRCCPRLKRRGVNGSPCSLPSP